MDYFLNARSMKSKTIENIFYNPILITAIWLLNVAWKKEIHTINHSV